ncbi:MAG: alpha-mannosidase, partial [Chloroflexi bacterium]|nr:alpha-mannosidase [Chloroflexota bacterium]
MLHDIRWTSQKIAKYLELIEPLVYRSKIPLQSFSYYELENPADKPIISSGMDDRDWQEIQANSCWGGVDKNFVLRTSFHIPTDWGDDTPIALYLPIGIAGDFSHPEALVYIDGESFAAVDRHHQEVILPGPITRDVSYSLTLHGWTGNLSQGKLPSLLMGECCLVEIDQATRDFISLARVAHGIADQLDRNDPIRAQLLTSLNQAFNLLDTREPLGKDFYASVPDAFHSLEEGVKLSGPPQEIQITAAGHAHIDIAWLWTLAQSRQKAGRTFHNVIRLMEQYPEFTFSQSQAQLYEFVRQDYPELFDHICKKIKEGQWEPLGGTWVEADCNISGGEALVRQLLLGRSYFRQHFGEGAESPVLWLPDVFGFPWSLPQLIKEAG